MNFGTLSNKHGEIIIVNFTLVRVIQEFKSPLNDGSYATLTRLDFDEDHSEVVQQPAGIICDMIRSMT